MINRKRIIARLDVKSEYLIKGVHFEGLRKIGDPSEFAQKYYTEGIDEILFIDSVASLYGRNNLSGIVKLAAENIFVPMTVGGGVRDIRDAYVLLRNGADKIAVNTAAVSNPKLINELAKEFGSQCVVSSIQVKKIDNKYKVFTDNAREPTDIDASDWVKKCQDLGTGEILISSIDKEGTRKGFELGLMDVINEHINVPLILSGGYGSPEHAVKLFKNYNVDAICIASAFHYGDIDCQTLKNELIKKGIDLRND